MKHLKVTSVVLAVAMCMSMLMPSVSVMADEATTPSETQTTETQEAPAPKETVKTKETEKEKPARETTRETDPEPVETEKNVKETEMTKAPEESEQQEPSESETLAPTETEKKAPEETTEAAEPSETEGNEPIVAEEPAPVTEETKSAQNGYSGTFGENNLTWSLNDSGVLTITGSGAMDVNFPWSGYESKIKSVKIGSGITMVAMNAFQNCTNLTSVTFPDSLISIQNSAFYNCPLTSITLPSKLTYIGNYAFKGAKITSISFPGALDEIGKYAFSDCTGLTSVTVPSNVNFVEEGAFQGCTNLKTVTLNCNLAYIHSFTFAECTALTSVNIPDQVEAIGLYAFSGCKSLTSITIPDSVKELQKGAFTDCTGLKEITLPAGITSFNGIYTETGVFKGCTGLTTITLPDTFTGIPEYTFEGCTGLKSINIPSSVKRIGKGAFSGCASLTDVYYGGTFGEWETISCDMYNGPLIEATLHAKGVSSYTGVSGQWSGGEWSLDENGTLTISGDGEIALDEKFRTPWSEYKNKIKKVVISSGITSIGDGNNYTTGVFSEYEYLVSVSLPSTITKIGCLAFYNCVNLTEINLPDSLTELGDQAFQSTALTSVTIPSKVKAISAAAFDECKSLSSVTISSGVTSILGSAFYGCVSLKSISLPSSITKIETYAFHESGLTSLTLPGSLREVRNAFNYCSELTEVVLSDGPDTICAGAFMGCGKLARITIPRSVEMIDHDAFSGCNGLTDVYYAGSQSFWNNEVWIETTGNDKLLNANIHYNSEGVQRLAVKLGEQYVGTGSVTFSPSSALPGETVTVNVVPDAGYKFQKIAVNGTNNIGTTFKMPNQSAVVDVYYQAISYNIKVTCSTGGTASVSNGYTTCSYGGQFTLKCVPNSGFQVYSFTINGAAVEPVSVNGNYYSFKMPASDANVYVNFNKPVYNLSVASSKYGSAKTDRTSASAGDTITVTATPNSGYVVDTVKYNGTAVSGTASTGYKFTMPASDVEVVVTFKKVSTYTITVSTSTGGSAEASATTSESGKTITVKATPATGYKLSSIKVNNSVISGNTFTMPAQNTTVYVTFAKISYTLSKKATSNGSFLFSKTTANYNDEITITSTPDEGFVVNTITINGNPVSGTLSNTYKFNMPASNVEVEVTFKKASYTLSISSSAGGSASLSASVADYGETITVTATPKTGYELVSIKVNDSVISGKSFTMPAKNSTVYVTFKLSSYTLTKKATSYGSFTLSKTTAYYKDTITVTATPNAGYVIDTVKYNGTTVTGSLDAGYSFSMPASNVEVEVTFKKASYTLSISSSAGGSASLKPTAANYGETITVTTTPNTGYQVDSIKVNGAAISGNTFAMPAKNTEVYVTFKKATYSVTKNTSSYGTISLSKTAANYKDTITVTATPITGYMIDKVTYNGTTVSGSPDSGYSFTMPAKAVEVVVTFKLATYSVTVSTPGGGSVAIDRNTAHMGDTVNITTYPAAGYKVDSIKVNGNIITTSSFVMKARNTEVVVTFKKIDYKISYTIKGNGNVSLSKTTANIGDVISITATPSIGYEVDTVKTDGPTVTNNSFTVGTANVVVEVTFKKKDFSVSLKPVSYGSVILSTTTAQYQDKVTFTATPAAGYKVSTVKVSGATVTGNPTIGYTFTMPAESVVVEVTFVLADYKITVKSGTGGTATASASIANYKDRVNISVTPDEGYELDKITINNESVASSFSMPNADIVVNVTFKKIRYTINLSIDYSDDFRMHGTAVLSQGTGVIGDQITVVTTPAENYYAIIKVNGVEIAGNEFTMPAAKVSVVVRFAKVKALEVGESATIGSAEYVVTAAAPENGTGTVRFEKYTDDGATTVSVPNTVSIKGVTYTVTSIMGSAFAGNKTMKVLAIGNYVTVIGAKACYGCKALVKVSGGYRVKTIGNMAFGGCPKLSSFVLTSIYLTKIGTYQFYGDKCLKTVYIRNTTRLTKSGVKKSLKSSSVKTVKVKKSKVKKYKKYFTKKNCGKKVAVKK